MFEGVVRLSLDDTTECGVVGGSTDGGLEHVLDAGGSTDGGGLFPEPVGVDTTVSCSLASINSPLDG